MTEPAITEPAITAALRGLRAPAPPGLAGSVLDHWGRSDSPLGPVLVGWTHDGVSFVRSAALLSDDDFLEAYRHRFGRPLLPADAEAAAPPDLERALYGEPGAAPRLDLRGLTPFQREVLAATSTIPAGETRPYAWVAGQAGRPGAVRAAGTALATNPVPLLIPCHRVIRSDGLVGNYLFGTETKQDLLRRERACSS